MAVHDHSATQPPQKRLYVLVMDFEDCDECWVLCCPQDVKVALLSGAFCRTKLNVWGDTEHLVDTTGMKQVINFKELLGSFLSLYPTSRHKEMQMGLILPHVDLLLVGKWPGAKSLFWVLRSKRGQKRAGRSSEMSNEVICLWAGTRCLNWEMV